MLFGLLLPPSSFFLTFCYTFLLIVYPTLVAPLFLDYCAIYSNYSKCIESYICFYTPMVTIYILSLILYKAYMLLAKGINYCVSYSVSLVTWLSYKKRILHTLPLLGCTLLNT